MISFEVNDVCGLAHCEWVGGNESRLLIGGNNAEGKSSLMLALGCCLSRNGNPKKLTRALLAHYRRNGSSNAFARLVIKGGKWGVSEWRADKGINWIAGEEHEESPQIAMEVIAGIMPVAQLDAKKWKEVFAEVKIPFRPFCEALARDFDRPIPKEQDKEDDAFVAWARKIWKQVNEIGVNEVIENYRQERLKFKGIWQDKASGDGRHEEWGDKKSPLWKPEGWQTEWEGRSIESMQQDVVDAQAAVSNVTVQDAVDLTKKEALEQDAGMMGQIAADLSSLTADKKSIMGKLEKEIEKANESWLSATKEWEKQIRKMNEMKARRVEINGYIAHLGASTHRVTCPHCGGGVKVRDIEGNHSLEKEGDGWQEEVESAKKKIAVLKLDLEDLDEEETEGDQKTKELLKIVNEKVEMLAHHKQEKLDKTGWYQQKEGELNERLRRSEAAAALLEKMQAADSDFSNADLDKAENELAQSKKALELRRRWAEAMSAANNVTKISMLISKLEKGHVSEELRKHGMDSLRRSAQKVGEALGYETDMVDGVPVLAGRPMPFCSESEQWILSFVVQRAMAYYFKAPVFLIDRFDVLDETRRKRFLADLPKVVSAKRNISVVISGTTTAAQDKAEKTDIILSQGRQSGEQLSSMGAPAKGD